MTDANDRVVAERRKALIENDFDPGHRAPADHRVANAAEYTAYQLGQINRKLDRLIAALELIANRN